MLGACGFGIEIRVPRLVKIAKAGSAHRGAWLTAVVWVLGPIV